MKGQTMVKSYINSFIKEEDGQDLVEYSLLLAFIALAAVTALTAIKGSLTTIWTKVQTNMASAAK